MTKSETTNALFAALSKAQAEMKPAVMDKTNPHFKSAYASLTSIIDTARGPLTKYSLSFLQMIDQDQQGYLLRTILAHASGEFIASEFKLLLARPDMQSLGSALTYAKRYALAALVGIVSDEDDDANAAMPPKAYVAKPAPPPQLTKRPQAPTRPPNFAPKGTAPPQPRAQPKGPVQPKQEPSPEDLDPGALDFLNTPMPDWGDK